MTFLGKALEIEKEKGSGMNIFQIMQKSCPSDYGFKDVECIKDGTAVVCMSCWNREMPNTEAKDELKERLELIDELKLVEYNKGLNDAWELAKEMIANLDGYEILSSYTPQEALAKLKAYEEAQSKVVVGDVVNHREYGNGIVTIEDGDFYHVVCANGEVVCFEKNRVTKTGKHIELASILEQIGE